MSGPRPPSGYDARWAAEVKRDIERRDAQNHKRGRDVEVGVGRLILTSPDGTRFSVTVDNSGAVTATPV
jgi:hypothetical protein